MALAIGLPFGSCTLIRKAGGAGKPVNGVYPITKLAPLLLLKNTNPTCPPASAGSGAPLSRLGRIAETENVPSVCIVGVPLVIGNIFPPPVFHSTLRSYWLGEHDGGGEISPLIWKDCPGNIGPGGR